MVESLSTGEAKADFSKVIDRVAFGKERITLTRRGRPLAVVVPVEDLEALEALEDAEDLRDAEAALKEFEASGKESIPWEEVKAKAGIFRPELKRRTRPCRGNG